MGGPANLTGSSCHFWETVKNTSLLQGDTQAVAELTKPPASGMLCYIGEGIHIRAEGNNSPRA